MSKKIYIVQENTNVKFTSSNLKAAWKFLMNNLDKVTITKPHSYEQVNRIMKKAEQYRVQESNFEFWVIIKQQIYAKYVQ